MDPYIQELLRHPDENGEQNLRCFNAQVAFEPASCISFAGGTIHECYFRNSRTDMDDKTSFAWVL